MQYVESAETEIRYMRSNKNNKWNKKHLSYDENDNTDIETLFEEDFLLEDEYINEVSNLVENMLTQLPDIEDIDEFIKCLNELDI